MTRPIVAALAAFFAAGFGWGFTPLAYRTLDAAGERIGYLHWEQTARGQAIPFAISTAGTPDIELSAADPALDEFEAIARAFDAWRQASKGRVDFSLSSTDTASYGYDGENVVFFADLGAVGYGGVTLITYENTTGRILDVDIHLNDHDIEWWTSGNAADGEPLGCPCPGNDPEAFYTNDVQGLTTHEVGHALGLDHSAVGRREAHNTPTMYPRGIWDVPGDQNLPPNSRYRTLELDDYAGLNVLFPHVADHGSAALGGVVHDRFDRPVLGAHVVARSLTTGEEIGAMSGMLEGPPDVAAYAMDWLPPGPYELRVEPLDGEPPGFVGPWNFGGIDAAVLPWSMPEETELSRTFHPFAHDAAGAIPLVLDSGEQAAADFHPATVLEPLPRFLRPAIGFPIAGHVNTAVVGPLAQANLRLSGNGVDQFIPIPADGSPFSVPVPAQLGGTQLDVGVQLVTTAGAVHKSLLHRMQLGLSREPLLVASLVGGQRLVAIDSKTLFDFERTERVLSFPLAQVFHRSRSAIYGTEFGVDAVSVVPLSRRQAEPLAPKPWDDDGDELLDVLEPVFGTNPLGADTDGDGDLDGLEVSQLLYDHPQGGGFEVIGAALSSGGTAPLGRTGFLAVFDVTHQTWATATMVLPPSGRFHLYLPPGPVYRLSLWTDLDDVATETPAFPAINGSVHVVGGVALAAPAPAEPLADPGSDPLSVLDGIGMFRPDVRRIALPAGADPRALALDRQERFLYVTGFGTHELYKVDTRKNQVEAKALVGGKGPLGVAVSHDGERVYVANHTSSTLSILRTADLALLQVIELGGRPHHIRAAERAPLAVISVEDTADLLVLDTTNDSLVSEASSGLGGTVYLHTQPTHGGLVLAGNFNPGSHEVALMSLTTEAVHTIDLGPEVNVTAGLALHPTDRRGWAVHWTNPELLEFDTATGEILRELDLPFIDTRDLLVISATRPLPLVAGRPTPPPPQQPRGRDR